MKLKRVLKVCITVLVIFILSSLIVGCLIAYVPSRMTKDHTIKVANMFLSDMNYSLGDFYNTYSEKIVETELISEEGHTIPVETIINNINNPTIVLVHWHETNHTTMYPIAEMFLDKGFNVVLYDQRSHGDNNAKTVTFGYYESKDLQDVIDYVVNEIGKGNTLGVLGQSMGASTVGYYLGTEHAHNNITFAIMESPFSSMDLEIKWNIESKIAVKLPITYFMKLGSFVSNIMFGFNFEDVNIIETIKKCKTPVMIMHSEIDALCPYEMGESLFNAIPNNNKKFVTFDNSKHVEAFFTESEKYQQEIDDFIATYVSNR